jgi:hypothetical protein
MIIRVERHQPPGLWTWVYPGSETELIAEFLEGFSPTHLATDPPGPKKNILGKVKKGSRGKFDGVLHLDGEDVWLKINGKRIDEPSLAEPAIPIIPGVVFETSDAGVIGLHVTAECRHHATSLWPKLFAVDGLKALRKFTIDQPSPWCLIIEGLNKLGPFPNLQTVNIAAKAPEHAASIIRLAGSLQALHLPKLNSTDGLPRGMRLKHYSGPLQGLDHADTSELSELKITYYSCRQRPTRLPPSLTSLTVSHMATTLLSYLCIEDTPRLRRLTIEGQSSVRSVITFAPTDRVRVRFTDRLSFEEHQRVLAGIPHAELEEPHPPCTPPPPIAFVGEVLSYLQRELDDYPRLAELLLRRGFEVASLPLEPLAKPSFESVRKWAADASCDNTSEAATRAQTAANILAHWVDPRSNWRETANDLANVALELAGGSDDFNPEEAKRLLCILNTWN